MKTWRIMILPPKSDWAVKHEQDYGEEAMAIDERYWGCKKDSYSIIDFETKEEAEIRMEELKEELAEDHNLWIVKW